MSYSPAKHFWDWFQQNSEILIRRSGQTKKERGYIYREICVHLKAYCGGNIFPEVITDEENGRACMIITAHGNSKYFSKIEKLVQKAPSIKGWKIHALYPPMPGDTGLAYTFPMLNCKARDMFFSPVELILKDGRYDLKIYVNEGIEVNDLLVFAATQVVYNVLGEKVTILNIGEVAVSYLEAASIQAQQYIMPLTQLPDFISTASLSGLMVNDQGAILDR